MCVIFVAHRAHPRYRLAVAANRDEFHTRPTERAGWWPDFPHILAGRDLTAGGTWMGVTRGGRFAAITNFHGGPLRENPPRSRGTLVLDFLVSDATPVAYVRSLAPEQYDGFSLFISDGEELAFRSNRYDAPERLEPGIYGLANGSLDSDEPRVARIKERIAATLTGNTISTSPLFEALSLPPLFLIHPLHGTRSSTVLLIDEGGAAVFEERSFDAEGRPSGAARESFQIARHDGSKP